MSRFAGMNLNMNTNTRGRDKEAEQLSLYNQSKKSPGPSTSNISGANIAPNNIFKKVGTNNNMPIFKANMPDRPSDAVLTSQAAKKTFTPMDTMTSSGLNQYDQLTKWSKLNQDSLAGKLKVRDDRYNQGLATDREAYVPPGYDSDMVPYAVKISAARIGLPQNMEGWKQYMNMGLGERASHLGTEVKSMGSELGTGFSRVVDDAKGIISNLPFMKFFGPGTTNNNTQEEVSGGGVTSVMENNPYNKYVANTPSAVFSQDVTGKDFNQWIKDPVLFQFFNTLSEDKRNELRGMDTEQALAWLRANQASAESAPDAAPNFLGRYFTPDNTPV
jgi:hypothetical protein